MAHIEAALLLIQVNFPWAEHKDRFPVLESTHRPITVVYIRAVWQEAAYIAKKRGTVPLRK